MATRIIQTIRTNKRLAIIAGSIAVCVGTLLVLQGGVLFDAAGRGTSWVVGKVVHSVAYKEVSPEGKVVERKEPAAQVAQVRLPADEVSPGTLPMVVEEQSSSVVESVPPPVGEIDAEEAPVATEALSAPPQEEEPSIEESFLSTFEPYRSYGLRDPMGPLVVPGKIDEMESRFSVYNLSLVGLAWKGGDRVAMLEDKKGRGYIYRIGEMVSDGARVISVGDDSITFALVRYGETTRLTLKLAKKEEEN